LRPLRFVEGTHCGEFLKDFVFQTAVWAFCVVIDPPIFYDFAGFADAGEPVLVQALIPEPVIETFDIGILGWLARIDEVQLHTVIIGPGIKSATSQFGAVIDDQNVRVSRLLLKRPAQDIALAYCWAHSRRKLHDVAQSGIAPIAQEGLAQIQALYRIEKDLQGTSSDQRHAARQERSEPIIDTLELWLAQSRVRVSAKSQTGEALKYIAKYWDGLILFLSDGRIEIDNNTVEHTIRPIALKRKNALFVGHDPGTQNWAVIASLIETCKLNGIEPHAYLSAVLAAIAGGRKQTETNELLPWNYAKPV
jgi:hypothetical protein